MSDHGDTDTCWVSVSSHRGRAQLRTAAGPLGDSYGRWSDGGRVGGEYYQITRLADMAVINRIKGVRVLRRAPTALFRRWTTS